MAETNTRKQSNEALAFDPLSPTRVFDNNRIVVSPSKSSSPFDDLVALAEKQNVDLFIPLQQSNSGSVRKKLTETRKKSSTAFSILDTDNPTEYDKSLNLSFLESPKKSPTFTEPDFQTSEEFESDKFRVRDASLQSEKKSSSFKKIWDRSLVVDNVLSIPAKVCAKQLILINSQLFQNIERKDLESMAWSSVDKWTRSKTVSEMIRFFNQITLWVSHEILDCTDTSLRVQKICRFIEIAKYLLEYNDYNGTKSIISGLEHSPVHRLKETWAMIGKHEQNVFDKLTEILSPQDNCINYRKRLKKQKGSIIPFLGVHLGDLIYLNEAKKQLVSKKDMNGAIQKESEIARVIDQIENYQSKSVYDFEEVPPVRSMLMQDKFIAELQNFVEDLHYTKSYQIEPKHHDSMRPSSKESTLEGHNMLDLISASVDDFSKSLSIGSEFGSAEFNHHSRSSSLSERSSSQQEAKKSNRQFYGGSVGKKAGKEFAAAIAEESHHQTSVDADFFDTKDVLKECMMQMKVKKDEHGKKPKTGGDWEQFFIRIKRGQLQAFRKTPLSVIEKTGKDLCIAIALSESSKVEIAGDYKKKPNVVRLNPKEKSEILLEAKNEAEMYEILVMLQKARQ